MATPFEDLPYVPAPDDLVDQAFSRASQAAESKSGEDSQRAMTQRATNHVSGELGAVVEGFPSFDGLDGFYAGVAAAAVDVDGVRQSLSRVDWAASQVERIARDAQQEISGGTDPIEARKRAFARISSVVRDVEDDLDSLSEARQVLVRVPEVSDLPTAVLAGMPNVGKSSFLRRVTNAKPEVASYPFTSKGLAVGHYGDRDRLQLVDAPGLLDRPESERNDLEMQAVEALRHAADAVVFILDPSESCGYILEDQLALLDWVRREFDAPVVVAANKLDLEWRDEVDVDHRMSLETGEGVEEVMEAVRSLLLDD